MPAPSPRHARPPLRSIPQRGWPLDAPTPPTGTPAPAPELVELMTPPRRPVALLLAAAGLALTLGLVVVGVLTRPPAPEPPRVSSQVRTDTYPVEPWTGSQVVEEDGPPTRR